MAERTVPELARETLKQLITRKLAPTPANYRSVFNEIGRLPNDPPFPLEELRKIAQQLPTRTPGQQKQRALLEYAVSQLNWQGVQDALVAYGGFTPRDNAESSSGFGALHSNGNGRNQSVHSCGWRRHNCCHPKVRHLRQNFVHLYRWRCFPRIPRRQSSPGRCHVGRTR